MTFLEESYELPVTPSNYTKFEDWETTKFRILPSWMDTDCIVFYEYFDKSQWENGKPVRSSNKFDETPWIQPWQEPKEKWSFKVWNYNLEQIQICSIGQKSIKEAIMNLIKDTDYGEPLWYDIKVKREWQQLETKYWVLPWPVKDFDIDLTWKDKKIDWVTYLESGTECFLNVD